MSDSRRLALRCALWTGLVHTGVAVLAVTVANTVMSPLGLRADLWLRLLDWPVMWLINWTGQNLDLVPPWASFGSVRFASTSAQILAHAAVGGAFYSLLAATAALAYARSKRADPPASTSRRVQRRNGEGI
jgi:hypothetical protein